MAQTNESAASPPTPSSPTTSTNLPTLSLRERQERVKQALRDSRTLSHEERVRTMMQGFNQATPSKPAIPDLKTLILRARLKLEETLEFLAAAGLKAYFRTQDSSMTELVQLDSLVQFLIEDNPDAAPDMELMVDALADDSVVNIGSFVALGVDAEPILRLVDENNLLKIATGTVNPVTGKFEKAPDHPTPNFQGALAAQGYSAPGLAAQGTPA